MFTKAKREEVRKIIDRLLDALNRDDHGEDAGLADEAAQRYVRAQALEAAARAIVEAKDKQVAGMQRKIAAQARAIRLRQWGVRDKSSREASAAYDRGFEAGRQDAAAAALETVAVTNHNATKALREENVRLKTKIEALRGGERGLLNRIRTMSGQLAEARADREKMRKNRDYWMDVADRAQKREARAAEAKAREAMAVAGESVEAKAAPCGAYDANVAKALDTAATALLARYPDDTRIRLVVDRRQAGKVIYTPEIIP